MKDNNRDIHKIIENDIDLKKVINTLKNEESIGVDVEADSMYHFKEKVCLIQLSSEKECFVVDPLKVNNTSQLKTLFINRNIKKVFHGADFDIRSLHRDFGIEVNNLFDTELASRFLGVLESGLDSVLLKKFNVKVDKKYQRSNWTKRPLPEEMIEYAAGDVKYLIPLAEMLEKGLEEKGRTGWEKEECKILSMVRHESTNNSPLFIRFKGAGKLDPRGLAVLEALLQYRMKVAEEVDRPLFKVFSNNSLMGLATEKPVAMKNLQNLNIMSPKLIRIYGVKFIAIIKNAMKIRNSDLPVYPRKRTPFVKPVVSRRIMAIKTWRDEIASGLNIDPTILFNKAMMNAIATKNPQNLEDLAAVEGLKKWQKKEFGRDVVSIISSVK